MFGRRRAEARAASFNARGPWGRRRRFLPRRPPSSRRPPRALNAATPSPARAPGRRHSRPPRSAATAAATAASPAPLLLRQLPGNAGSHGAHLPNRPGGKPLPARTGPPWLLAGPGSGGRLRFGSSPVAAMGQGEGLLGPRRASGASSGSSGRRCRTGSEYSVDRLSSSTSLVSSPTN